MKVHLSAAVTLTAIYLGAQLASGQQPNFGRMVQLQDLPPNALVQPQIGTASSYSQELSVSLESNGAGLRVASPPTRQSVAGQAGLEQGDVIVRVNGNRIDHAGQLDDALRQNGLATLTIVDVNTGRWVRRTVHASGRFDNGRSNQGGNLGAFQVSVKNTTFGNVQLQIQGPGGGASNYVIGPGGTQLAGLPVGGQAWVYAGQLSLPLQNPQAGAHYTISRRGGSLHVEASFGGGFPQPGSFNPPTPFMQADKMQALASGLQVSGTTFQGFRGESLMVSSVQVGGLGSRLGLQVGDRIRPASMVGIPVYPGGSQRNGSIVNSILVYRNGQRFETQVRGRGADIVLPQ